MELREQALHALSFLDDIDAAAQIADRFAIKYGPAYELAPDEAARDRVWGALRHYLVTRPTRRKPWELTGAEAEEAITALEALVAHPRGAV